jgi:hypothetical protein
VLTQNTLISSKLDELAYAIHRLTSSFQPVPQQQNKISEFNKRELLTDRNLRVILSSAEEYVSECRAPIQLKDGSSRPSLGPATTQALVLAGLGQRQTELAENWLLNPLKLNEGDLSGEEDSRDAEFHHIWTLRHQATQSYKLAKHSEAEQLLEKALGQSNAKYGDQYAWKAETTEMLVKVCRRQRKWAKAEEILQAKLEVEHQGQMRMRASDSLHALAEISLAQRDLTRAKSYCLQAIQEKEAILGARHPSYYDSKSLLVRVYHSENELTKARMLEDSLPHGYWCEECQEIDELNRMSFEEAAENAGTQFLKYVLPNRSRSDWVEIRKNISKRGLAGSGVGKYTLFHAFAEYGYEAPLRQLLELEPDLDALDERGLTALHLAASRYDRIVQLLIKKQSNVDVPTRDEQQTALIIAAKTGMLDIVVLLLDNDAGIDVPDAYEYTALHHAAMEGVDDVARELLKRGADIKREGNGGRTPLHCAASRGQTAIVRLFLNNGADPGARDRMGKTALTLAREEKRTNVVDVFLSRQTSAQSTPVQATPQRKWTFLKKSKEVA